jgi:hypothetical protein
MTAMSIKLVIWDSDDKDYFITHPNEPFDCLNIKESEARFLEFDLETIQEVKRLFIEEERLDSESEFFRPKGFCDVIFVTRNLAEAIDKEGFTGTRWIELTNYH